MSFPIYSIRILGVLITAALFLFSKNNQTWTSWVYALGFGHYLISLVYSKKQITNVMDQARCYLPFGLAAFTGAALYFNKLPLVLYFGFHHAFNETYILNREFPVEKYGGLKAMRTSSAFLNFFCYLAVLQHMPELQFLNIALLRTGMLVSALFFFYFLNTLGKSFKPQELLENCAFEIIGLLLVAVSFYENITFLQIVCYHFIFWMLFPLSKMWTFSKKRIPAYLTLTTGLLTAFILLSPVGLFSYKLWPSHYAKQFILWSYIHITVSFALSDAHPSWVTRWFQPVKTSA